jgi:putative membrane-bound dehydrogenase-like protein
MLLLTALAILSADAPKANLLFLGDNGHHRPKARFDQLQPVLAAHNITITYTDKVEMLDPEKLKPYDGLIVFANQEKITPAQEKALLDYVASGKGFIPLHCASFCFLNSPKYIELVGAQFRSHETGVFRTTLAESDHPILKGYQPFESWDETYVHHRHNPDRTILEYRIQGNQKEPWTWVRNHGKGRVFYTAWGHDQRTWGHPGFQNLVERGIRWAIGQDTSSVVAYNDRPAMTKIPKDLPPFEYEPANLPNYLAGKQWGTTGENINRAQRPLSPQESMKHISTPVDFKVELFVSEPQIGKAICMNWDERGRLWVAETVDYPNEKQPMGGGRDRIRICEDTDGDGKADKFTVFAEKLSIPTSMCFANGGVIVAQAPEMLFLKDTNGDDVADEKKVLFTGFSTADTHAGPSNLTYGFDNWIYAMIGYAGFRGHVGGEDVSFRQGFFRFKSDGSKIEFLRSVNNNAWGVGFSEDGQLFGSTANGCPSVHLPIPNRYYERVRGWSSSVLQMISSSNKIDPIRENVRMVDHHGGFTAGAGSALYTARRYPKEYWNRTQFVCEPTASIVATFQLFPDGASYRSHNSWNLFASDDEWTAPIMAEVGPDGCVWVLDWYNIIVQHNPTPRGFKTGKGAAYETPLRDKKHARVYRIVPVKGAEPPKQSLKDATPEQLVATLKNDNLFWRRHAQRLLVERGNKDVVPALVKLVEDKSVDEIGLNVGAIHAIWTLKGLGALNGTEFSDASRNAPKIIQPAVQHASPAVRYAILRALPNDSTIAAWSAIVNEKDPRLVAAVLLAISDSAPNSLIQPYLYLARHSELLADRWTYDAAVAAASTYSRSVLVRAAQAKDASPGRLPSLLTQVAEHFARSNTDDEAIKAILTSLAKGKANTKPIVAGLIKGWPKGKPANLDAEADAALVALLQSGKPEDQANLIALASRLGSKKLDEFAATAAKGLMKAVADSALDENARLAAVKQLMEIRRDDPASIKGVIELIDAKTPSTLAAGLINALGTSEADALGEQLSAKMNQFTPTVRTAALATLLRRPNWTKAVLASVEKGKTSWDDFALDQKQALASHPDSSIASLAKKMLARGGGLPNADRVKVVESFASMISQKANATNGKAVYKKHCSVCHKHSGEGGDVGPDLTGMAVHPKEELLVHLLDPSRSVEGNFRAFTVAMEDGRVLNGLLASETKTSIELVDAQAKKHTLLREEIEKLIASNKSLMPDGFEKQCTQQELLDLLEFMTQRGKYLPLDIGKVATVTTGRGMFFNEESPAERLILSDWKPKTVDGIPFIVVDPQDGKRKNVVMLYGPQGSVPPKMPRSVKMACNAPAKAIHLLSGVSGWGFPLGRRGSTSMTVKLTYADGTTEEHPLRNGEHFADYISRNDVPGSKFAFSMQGRQMRMVTIAPKEKKVIKEIDLVKGRDQSAPIVMAVTVEGEG